MSPERYSNEVKHSSLSSTITFWNRSASAQAGASELPAEAPCNTKCQPLARCSSFIDISRSNFPFPFCPEPSNLGDMIMAAPTSLFYNSVSCRDCHPLQIVVT